MATKMTLVEGGAVKRTTADDLALVTFEALRTEGWSEVLADALADLVRDGARRMPVSRVRRLARLLAEGTSAPAALDDVAA